MAKLTRRNSLAGITSLFKEKKDKEEDGSKSKKKKKGGKSSAAEASVSHVTAELDSSEWSTELNGLTPAARLARQHTLKTNAEAAAKAKAQETASALRMVPPRQRGRRIPPLVREKHPTVGSPNLARSLLKMTGRIAMTTTQKGRAIAMIRVSMDGMILRTGEKMTRTSPLEVVWEVLTSIMTMIWNLGLWTYAGALKKREPQPKVF